MVQPNYTETNKANPNNLFDIGAWRQAAGNLVEGVGHAVLPIEFGLSELIAGGPTPRTYANAQEEVKGDQSPLYSPVLASYGGSTPTQKTGTQQTTNNGSSGSSYQDQWAAAGHAGIAPVGYHGESGGGDNGVSASDINDAYQPAIDALQGYLDAANAAATTGLTSIDTRVTNQNKQLDVQGGELLGETATEQTKFNDSLRSALEDAIRAYNALAQQGNARFGRGNSAGGAVGELANQEFLRQQGSTQKQQLSGDLQFETERSKIRNFVEKNKDDLEMYHNEAIDKVNNDLKQALAEIGGRRGEIETNKTRDKLSALQNTRDNLNRIAEAKTKYIQDSITTALSNMESVLGRPFTIQERAVNYAELANLYGGSSNNFQASATPASKAIRYTNYKNPDELAQAGLTIDQNTPGLTWDNNA